jgi:4-hydroxy-tetrahydrodipicolinate synthase
MLAPDIGQLRGVLPALVSPLHENGEPDQAAIKRLVNHVLAGGVHGLVPLGSTGEAASLSETSRRRILADVLEAAESKVPVLCGVAQSHLAAARSEVKAAQDLGAAGVLVAPPFYYPIDQETVVRFYRELASVTALPIFLYNIPQFTKVVADPTTVDLLAREGAIAGIKDSSRDFEYFESICLLTRDLPQFRVFTGSDTMLVASLVMGGSGTICGAANVAPDWIVRVFDNVVASDWSAARKHQDEVIKLVGALRGNVFPSATKMALYLQGICEPWPAPPVHPLSQDACSVLQRQLQTLGLLTAEARPHLRKAR